MSNENKSILVHNPNNITNKEFIEQYINNYMNDTNIKSIYYVYTKKENIDASSIHKT